jgi:DNA processing protein
MPNNHIHALIILTSAPQLGPVGIKRLLSLYHHPEAIVNATVSDLKKSGLTENTIQALKTPNLALIEKTKNWLKNPLHSLLTQQDPDYPSLLKEIHSAPPLLYVQGNKSLLNYPQIALVGSRMPSPYGIESAKKFAMELCEAGLVITSGLALGIDAASHEGALKINGATIAVLGCGLNQIYPKRHEKLAREIITAGGAVISEFPLTMPPCRENFPIRNRIISGLSLGTLVVEASLKSGSLITARLANEFGREVFAIPGTVRNSLARGCHFLIKQGAKLVETTEDILEELALKPASSNSLLPQALSEEALDLDENCAKLFNCMDDTPLSMDQLSERSGFETAQVSSLLIFLELKGYICLTTAGYTRIKK